ncbi:hypothetical protein [Paenibacillus urinalis]|uniref:hypothetical protein n=1 Tax=Paenibacillus urinalis TaxID=521520 RepID=UPI003629DBBC
MFEPIEGIINDYIDQAYCEKYKDNPYLSTVIGTRVRSATRDRDMKNEHLQNSTILIFFCREKVL